VEPVAQSFAGWSWFIGKPRENGSRVAFACCLLSRPFFGCPSLAPGPDIAVMSALLTQICWKILSVCIQAYIYVCTFVYIYIYIYIVFRCLSLVTVRWSLWASTNLLCIGQGTRKPSVNITHMLSIHPLSFISHTSSVLSPSRLIWSPGGDRTFLQIGRAQPVSGLRLCAHAFWYKRNIAGGLSRRCSTPGTEKFGAEVNKWEVPSICIKRYIACMSEYILHLRCSLFQLICCLRFPVSLECSCRQILCLRSWVALESMAHYPNPKCEQPCRRRSESRISRRSSVRSCRWIWIYIYIYIYIYIWMSKLYSYSSQIVTNLYVYDPCGPAPLQLDPWWDRGRKLCTNALQLWHVVSGCATCYVSLVIYCTLYRFSHLMKI